MADTDDIDPNDLLPESWRQPDGGVEIDAVKNRAIIADLAEARSKLTRTDFAGAREEGVEAMRAVLHKHGLVLQDEVD